MVRPGIEIGNASDVGVQREENQDYFGYWESEDAAIFRRKGRLAIVADGMGGMAGGYAASRIAVEAVRDAYAVHPAEDPRDALRAAVEQANAVLHRKGVDDPGLKGMGTTLTAVVLREGLACFAHVGDTRAYLVRAGRVVQLTEDQSLVARMVREGKISAAEAAEHPERNVISQAVGHKPTIDVDTSIPPQRVLDGDILVLCTDGLHGQVTPEEIARVVASAPAQQACRTLVDMANGRGGPDNITVQVLRIGAPRAAAARAVRPGRSLADTLPPGAYRSSVTVRILITASLLILGAGIGSGVTYLAMRGRGGGLGVRGAADVGAARTGDAGAPGPASADAAADAGSGAVLPVDAGGASVVDAGDGSRDEGASDALPGKGAGPVSSRSADARSRASRRAPVAEDGAASDGGGARIETGTAGGEAIGASQVGGDAADESPRRSTTDAGTQE